MAVTEMFYTMPARIEDADWNLRNFVRRSELKNRPATKKSKDDKRNGIANSPEETTNKILESHDSHLFDIVSFQKDNFVQGLSSPGESLCTILWVEFLFWNLSCGSHILVTVKYHRCYQLTLRTLKFSQINFRRSFSTRKWQIILGSMLIFCN